MASAHLAGTGDSRLAASQMSISICFHCDQFCLKWNQYKRTVQVLCQSRIVYSLTQTFYTKEALLATVGVTKVCFHPLYSSIAQTIGWCECHTQELEEYV